MKHNLLFLLLFLLPSVCHADDTGGKNSTPMDAVYPRSPQAAALARYGEYPVGHTTGVPDITIPLYEVKVGDYTLPVSISYHASGIKVNDVASTVGLGWSLNAGGVITRTVCGAPDLEYASKKYYDYDETKELIEHVKESGQGVPELNRLISGGGGRVLCRDYDCASDRYIYNFSTKNGIFRYSYRDERFIAVNHSNMIFEVFGEAENSYFHVVDTDGTEYYFKQLEYAGVLDDENKTDLSSWYLTEVRTKNGDIKLRYTQSAEYFVYNHFEILLVGGFELYGTSQGGTSERARFSKSYAGHCFRIPVVSSIEWEGNAMTFSYANDREDVWKTRLAKIEVKNSDGDVLKTVDFDNHSFWGNKSEEKRMMLRGMDVSDEGKYGFSYNDTSGSLPPYSPHDGPRADFREDYWGYYNGTNSKYSIPKEAFSKAWNKHRVCPFSARYPISDFADRDPVEYYLKFGILQSVTYPTGGRTDFEFEWNGQKQAGLRVKSISNYDIQNDLVERKTYEYDVAVNVADHPLETMAYPAYFLMTIYPYAGYMTKDECMVCVGEPELPISYSNSVFYSVVHEVNANGDRVEHEYSTVPEPGWLCGRAFLGEVPHFVLGAVHDYGTLAPFPVRKSYSDSAGRLMKEETYDYGNYEVRRFSAGTKIASYLYSTSNLGRDFHIALPSYKAVSDANTHLTYSDDEMVFDSITVHSMTCQLLSKTVKDFTTGVTTTETYTYDK
ncbi:MAG: hypothetical protein K2G12_00785, partial [Prevotella sp.]|nr:hypothetical protein [Prevotella sp.]